MTDLSAAIYYRNQWARVSFPEPLTLSDDASMDIFVSNAYSIPLRNAFRTKLWSTHLAVSWITTVAGNGTQDRMGGPASGAPAGQCYALEAAFLPGLPPLERLESTPTR